MTLIVKEKFHGLTIIKLVKTNANGLWYKEMSRNQIIYQITHGLIVISLAIRPILILCGMARVGTVAPLLFTSYLQDPRIFVDMNALKMKLFISIKLACLIVPFLINIEDNGIETFVIILVLHQGNIYTGMDHV